MSSGHRESAQELDHPLFLGASSVLMSSHDGAIQGHDPEVAAQRKLGKDSLPNSRLAPAREALVDAVPGPKDLRQVTPWDSSSGHEKDGFDKQAVVGGGSSSVSGFAW